MSETKEIDSENEEKKRIEKGMRNDYAKKRTNDSYGLYDQDRMPNISIATWFTGLSRAKIIGEPVVTEHEIQCEVSIVGQDDHYGYLTVKHRGGEYTDNSEIARVLKYKNIDPETESFVDELVGLEIPVYIEEFAYPSNDETQVEWRPHIPRKFDRVGKLNHKLDTLFRLLGHEGKNQHNIKNLLNILFILSFVGISTFYITSGFAFQIWYVTLSILISFFVLFLNSIVSRSLEYSYEKVIEYKDHETIGE